MKIAILILYTDNWGEIAEVTTKNAFEYCRKHEYELVSLRYNIDYPSDFGYNKLTEIKYLFDDGYDLVMSMDADTLITNHQIEIEEFIKEKCDFYICKDVNGINAGVFIIKNSEWSIAFLDELLSKRGKPEMYCEQDAIRTYMEENNDEKICILPHPTINSLLYELYPEFGKQKHEDGQWGDGDFVLHLPALSIEKRIEILKNTPIIK